MANYIHILEELEDERTRLDEAILTVKRLAVNSTEKRRGRPPAWMTELKKGAQTSGKRRGRPPGSKNRAKEVAA